MAIAALTVACLPASFSGQDAADSTPFPTALPQGAALPTAAPPSKLPTVAPKPQPSPTVEPTQQSDPTDGYVSNTEGDGLRLRAEPSTSAESLATMPESAALTIIGSTTADGLDWYQVKYDDLTGWSAKSYIATGTAPEPVATAEPVAPQATPVPPQPTEVPQPTAVPTPAFQFPIATQTNAFANCGVTDLQGRILDGNGGAIPGITVRVRSQDGSFNKLTNPSSDIGFWEIVIANEAVAGTWLVNVEIGGKPESPVFTTQTTGPETCNDPDGVQSPKIDFRKG